MMRGLLKRHPNAAATLFGVLVVLLFWGGIEGVFFLLEAQRLAANPPFVRSMEGLSEDHPLLGYRPRPGMVKHARKDRPGEVAYECTYTIDPYGRRVTPLDDAAGRDEFALFFGGSFTFGEGVDDRETLPAAFGKAAGGYRPYNYGYVGYGPQNMVMHLQRPGFAAEIAEARGVAVYTFIDAHMARAVGSMRVTTGWGRRLPYLSLDAGELHVHGTFEVGRPVVHRFFEVLSWSPALRYLNVDMPTCDAPQDFALVAAMFRDAQARLHALFPESTLYVLFYPYSRFAAPITALLADSEVQVLDYTALFDPDTEAQFALRLADGHPTPAAHRIVGNRLAADLAAH